jgi:hypothetical protein
MSKASTLDIGQHIFEVIAPTLRERLSGDVYPEDCRPFNSSDEDAVVVVISAMAEQIQTGRARVNIYVADIDNGSGRAVPNIERLQEIASWGELIVDELNDADTDYNFTLAQAPQMVADNEIRQHFISIVLDFKRITFNR